MNARSLYWHLYLVAYILIGSLKLLLLRLTCHDPTKRTRKLHQLEKKWARDMFRASGSRITIEGRHHYRPRHSYVFYANHQSSFDIFALLGFVEIPLVFMAKPFYFKLPVFGWAMRVMGHFSLDRKNKRKAITAFARARLTIEQESLSLIIFPEGTRSKDGTIRPFKTSTLKIFNNETASMRKKLLIIPVTLIATRKIQQKGSLKIHPAQIKIVFNAPIAPPSQKLAGLEKKALMLQIETAIRNTYEG